jgi:hypothetical protein
MCFQLAVMAAQKMAFHKEVCLHLLYLMFTQMISHCQTTVIDLFMLMTFALQPSKRTSLQ